MESGSKPASRRMLYPYTITAKLMQFPNRYYWNNCWLFKYWVISVVACVPIFYKFQKMTKSPENIKKWEETRRLERMPQHH